MKKFMLIVLALIMCLSTFVSCGEEEDEVYTIRGIDLTSVDADFCNQYIRDVSDTLREEITLQNNTYAKSASYDFNVFPAYAEKFVHILDRAMRISYVQYKRKDASYPWQAVSYDAESKSFFFDNNELTYVEKDGDHVIDEGELGKMIAESNGRNVRVYMATNYIWDNQKEQAEIKRNNKVYAYKETGECKDVLEMYEDYILFNGLRYDKVQR